MADDDQTEEEETLDASYKPDASTLDGDEADFAKALGFGADGNEGAETTAADEDTAAVAPAVADDDATEDGEAEVGESSPVEAAADPGQDDPPSASPAAEEAVAGEGAPVATQDAPIVTAGAEDEDDDAEAASESDRPSVDYEEIQPRPASEGMQETLLLRADEVMARSEIEAPPMAPPDSGGAATATLAAEDEALEEMRRDLSDRDRALAAALADLDATHAELATVRAAQGAGGGVDEKELEETRVELETVTIERDQLIDQLAAKSGELVQSQRAAEQLEASLRAARGALVPLPEGERALRAEVIGLRGRLDDAAQENVRLASEVASVATELAIAAARVEDRQHEIDFHTDRADDLEKLAAEKEEQTEAAIAQHREALTLATRLQAENNE
ncbi:MAG: hypothetical protein NXI30_27480, partial [bacterium]|nr:hypothetical protein [bacterium]